METNNNLKTKFENLKYMHKRSNLYMTLIIITTIMSVVCVTVIAGIWIWLYVNNNFGRPEYKAAHIVMFSFGIIEIILMAAWLLGMIGSVIIFRRQKHSGKLRFYIHYIGVLSFHIVSGIVVYVLFYLLLEWRIMESTARQAVTIVVIVFEILRILLLISIFVTSIIYLKKNKKTYLQAQQIVTAPEPITTLPPESKLVQ